MVLSLKNFLIVLIINFKSFNLMYSCTGNEIVDFDFFSYVRAFFYIINFAAGCKCIGIG